MSRKRDIPELSKQQQRQLNHVLSLLKKGKRFSDEEVESLIYMTRDFALAKLFIKVISGDPAYLSDSAGFERLDKIVRDHEERHGNAQDRMLDVRLTFDIPKGAPREKKAE